jgi:hypothetical protein
MAGYRPYEQMNKLALLLIFLWVLSSCGGVIGNIEKYEFPHNSAEELRMALEFVYLKHPEIQKTDTTMYGMNDGESFYFVLVDGDDRYVFECSVISYHDPRYPIDLSLTTATKWGEVMELAPRMGFWKKRKYRNLFEDNILPKIREALSNASQQKL